MTQQFEYRKPIPVPVPETQYFWDKVKDHELWIQRCQKCHHVFFYPRFHCPQCMSEDVEWVQASGRGTLYTYMINYRPAPGIENEHGVPWLVVYGISNNTRAFWSLTSARQVLGYEPEDDSEVKYADDIRGFLVGDGAAGGTGRVAVS